MSTPPVSCSTFQPIVHYSQPFQIRKLSVRVLLNRYYQNHEVAELRLADNKIFGAPAANTTRHSNNLNNSRGAYGEEIIGNILNLLVVETPGAYVCHSVAFIDDTQGETDHVLIYQDRIILVETKAYSGYVSYKVNKEGVLTGSTGKGRYRKINDSNVYSKLSYYQDMFPSRKVQAVIAVARDDVRTWSENGRYKVASLDNFMKLIREQFKDSTPVNEPAWGVVKQFAVMCVKPTDSSGVIKPVTTPLTIGVKEELKPKPKQVFSHRPSVLRH